MKVALTDFSSKELGSLLTAIANYQAQLAFKIDNQKEYTMKLNLGYESEFENMELWKTQVIDAKVAVLMRERVASN